MPAAPHSAQTPQLQPLLPPLHPQGREEVRPRQPSPGYSPQPQLSIVYTLKNTTQIQPDFSSHPLDSEGASGGTQVRAPSAAEPDTALPKWDQAALPESPSQGLLCPILPAGNWGPSWRSQHKNRRDRAPEAITGC